MKRAFILLLLCLSSWASAMAVGDKPELKFKATNGKEVDLSKMNGKMVLIDFWATWCGPCMAEAGHMVELHNKYADKGLEFIGISLDQDAAKMAQVAKSSGFVWPQYFDGLVWKNRLAQGWGVNSIPRTFLIGPDGTILWTGHPATIDAPLAKAFKEHPPVLVDPKIVEQADDILKQAESRLKENDPAGAIKLLAKFPVSAKLDKKVAKRVENVQKNLEQYATSAISEADQFVADKKYMEAIAKLKDLAAAMESTPMAKTVRDKLSKLMTDPAARDAIAAIDRSAKGDEELAAAQKLKDAGKDQEAYLKFKSIAKQFAGTPSASAAAQIAADYEKDPDFVKKANDAEAATKGKAAISLAENYQRVGKTDQAKKKYQEVIDQYPGTTYAETAQKALAEIGQ